MDHRKRVVTNRLLTSQLVPSLFLSSPPPNLSAKIRYLPFCYHRKRVFTKRTLGVLKKMDYFFLQTPDFRNSHSFRLLSEEEQMDHRKRVVTKQTLDVWNSVFYPVNAGIESTMLTKGL
jgi:hypothetical protein